MQHKETIESKFSKIQRVPLSSIKTDESYFQVRDFSADGVNESTARFKSRNLLNNLIEALETQPELDPIITIKTENQSYIVVDGHHRLEAYKSKKIKTVPIRVFSGTQEEARLLAHRTNSKASLAMTKPQRMQSAWKIYATDSNVAGLSVRRISEVLGVSIGTVQNFKSAKENLKEEELTEENLPSWKELKKDFSGIEPNPDNYQAEKERKIKEVVADLNKIFGTKLDGDPTLIKDALCCWLADIGYEVRETAAYSNIEEEF